MYHVAQLSLTNRATRCITTNGKTLKQSRDHKHALSLLICHPVARIDIAYLCTKYDDFRFSRSSDMIGAPKILMGNLPDHASINCRDGLSSVGLS